MPRVSIIVPTRNGMPLVERCLHGILSQAAPWPYEVIVIDSASTDGTWELVESLPVRRFQIQPHQFNHGATRNFGAAQAQGEYLVFSVQDAIPADERWLAALVAPLDNPRVAGAYSRQCPRPESRLLTHYMTLDTVPNSGVREIKSLPGGVELADLPPGDQFRLCLFQDASSCIRRSVWQALPFARLPYGEDIEWGRRVIQAGYAIVYEPTSAVYHSHDRSAWYTLKRAYADHYQAAELFGWIMLPSPFWLARCLLWSLRRALAYVLRSRRPIRERVSAAAAAPVFLAALGVGQFVGSRAYSWRSRHVWVTRLDLLLRVGV